MRLRTNEIAVAGDLTDQQVRVNIRSGVLPAARVGKRQYRVELDDAAAFLGMDADRVAKAVIEYRAQD